MNELWSNLSWILGLDLDPKEMNALQMGLRTVLVYTASLVIVRLGQRRLIADQTAFDIVVGFMLGSLLGRSINGSAPLLESIIAGAVLVGLHWLIAFLTYHSRLLGKLAKGERDVILIQDGVIQNEAMRRQRLSDRDLHQSLRLNNILNPKEVKIAYLERNGRISSIRKGD
ncbi:MAG TPA: YetF domain-containing protein [Acidobacteriota bacterium]|nr:YetF domain-containing protein [Acidobacteriota bacterium]